MANFLLIPTQIVAVDNDLDACKTYAVSHGAALVNGMVALDSLQFVNSSSDPAEPV